MNQSLCKESEILCGFSALCADNLQCVCEDGYYRSGDFDPKLLSGPDCYGNNIATYFLYSILIFFSLLSIYLHLRRVKRFSQVKRTLPLILSLSLAITISCLKLQNFNRVVGEDIIITTCLAILLIFAFISIFISQRKYLKTQIKFATVMKSSYLKTIRKREFILIFGIFLSIISQIILFSSVFIKNFETKYILIQISLIILLICSVLYLIQPFYAAKSFESDIKVLNNKKVIRIIIISYQGRINVALLTFLLSLIYIIQIIFSQVGVYFLPFLLNILVISTIILVYINQGEFLKYSKKYKHSLLMNNSRKSLSLV